MGEKPQILNKNTKFQKLGRVLRALGKKLRDNDPQLGNFLGEPNVHHFEITPPVISVFYNLEWDDDN